MLRSASAPVNTPREFTGSFIRPGRSFERPGWLNQISVDHQSVLDVTYAEMGMTLFRRKYQGKHKRLVDPDRQLHLQCCHRAVVEFLLHCSGRHQVFHSTTSYPTNVICFRRRSLSAHNKKLATVSMIMVWKPESGYWCQLFERISACHPQKIESSNYVAS